MPEARPKSALCGLVVLIILGAAGVRALPVIDPGAHGLEEERDQHLRNLLSVDQLQACIRQDVGGGLMLDLAPIQRLLDGRDLEAVRVTGTVNAGPWPFEAVETGFSYRRFRTGVDVREGRALLPLKALLKENINSEGWTDGGPVLLRLNLRLAQDGPDEELVRMDLPLRFRMVEGRTLRLPAVLEGPMVCRVDNRLPGTAVIALRTDLPCRVEVEVEDVGRAASQTADREHEIELTGLPAGAQARYRILLDGEAATEWLDLRLPAVGETPLRFVFMGDSREGVGGGDRAYLGVNLDAIERLTALAYEHDARFLLMGGDLINGYTTNREDFATQLFAWKQAAAGFWRERPIHPAMGNHEALLRVYHGQGMDWLGLDRWPYAEESAERVFADAFCNPLSGPSSGNPELPGYEENVYSVRHGCVTAVCFNNNWWYSSMPALYGGCPEGYLLEDQLAWIEAEIRAAQEDPACRYIVYFAQEPVFPCGGHLTDAMWWGGDNRVRAWQAGADGALTALGPGLIEVRNRLVRAIAACPKSAAVLAGDEHAYYKLLLTPDVPAGDPARDDPNGDGVLCGAGEPCSPLPGLASGIWFLTSGGAGAPWYAQQRAPWNGWWMDRPDGVRGFHYSSQENLLLFEATESGLSMRAINSFGEEIDRIDNLMDARRPGALTGAP